jgi:putative transposase
MHSVSYDEPRSWSLRRLEGENPALYVQGIGEIKLSASAARQVERLRRRGGEPRTLTLTEQPSGAWRATVAFRNVAAVPLDPSDQIGGIDRGIRVTAALPDGTLLRMPGFLEEAQDLIAELSRRREQVSSASPEYKSLNRRIAKVYARAWHRSENWARHQAKDLVARYGVIALEDLKLEAMRRSAKGTKEEPGNNVAAKRELNRQLSNAALGRLARWICVKAEEAGRRVWKVDPRYSSQTCVACGHAEPKNRCGTKFKCCSCGHSAHADVNAAQVLSCRGAIAEAAWRDLGAPLNRRPTPRLQWNKAAGTPCHSGPGRLLTR